MVRLNNSVRLVLRVNLQQNECDHSAMRFKVLFVAEKLDKCIAKISVTKRTNKITQDMTLTTPSLVRLDTPSEAAMKITFLFISKHIKR